MNPDRLNDLVFEMDGTLSAEQLEKLDPETRERLTSPEFIEHARVQIAIQEAKKRQAMKTGRRESKRDPIRFMPSGDGPNRKARRALLAGLR